MSCAVTSIEVKDERFAKIREHYAKYEYNDDHLVQMIQMCREHNGYDPSWMPETPAQFGTFTRYMRYHAEADRLKKTSSTLGVDELYNLYTTVHAAFSPEKLENRINMLYHLFISEIDRLEKNNTGHLTRKQLIEGQEKDGMSGIKAIFSSIFDRYSKFYADIEGRLDKWMQQNPAATEEQIAQRRKIYTYQADEFKTVLAHKERLSALAISRIGETEGFVVNARDFRISLDEQEDTEMRNIDEDTGKDTDGNTEESNKEERFIDYRTTKLLDTISVKARRFISKIYKVDSAGKVVVDDLGFKQYVNARQAAYVLKRALVTSTPDTMIADLKVAAESHPWVSGIIKRIEDNPDYHALVYNNFKGSETTYARTDIENGKYATHIANSRSAGNALMQEAGTNISSGLQLDKTTSIVEGYGALKSPEKIAEIAKDLEELNNSLRSRDSLVRDINMVEGKNNQPATAAMEAFLAMNPEVPVKSASYLRGIGFNVTADDVRTVAMQPMSEKSYRFIVPFSERTKGYGRNKLYHLVGYVSAVYKKAQDQKNGQATGRYLYNTMSNTFRNINSILALAKYNEVESRVISNGKSLSAHNNTNLIHQVMDTLANKAQLREEEYQRTLEEEFLRFEGMSLGFGEKRQIHGWLRLLRDNVNSIRDFFKVVDISDANHVEYEKLTREQKLTNSLVMFLDGGNLYQNSDYSGFEVPIQSDYSTAYQFVIAPNLSEEQIVDELTNEVLIELERMNAIDERADDDNRAILSVYEKQGAKFQIFLGMNDAGLRRDFANSRNAEEAESLVRNAVREQLYEYIERDLKDIEDSKVLANKLLSNIGKGGKYKSLYSKDGYLADLSDEGRNILRWYSANVFYAREQITKILDGGLEQFNGITDFEKRNMLTHATRTSLDTRATWKGKPIEGRTDVQHVAYIGDDVSRSAFYDELASMIDVLKEQKLITPQQAKYMKKGYENIKTTDGQGLRTLDSYRTIMIQSSQWTDSLEQAYNRIKSGKPKRSDIQTFMQNKKPVYTGYETIPAAGPNQKPVRLTVLHKYAEMVLLPTEIAKYCIQANSVPFKALSDANEILKKSGRDVDMFIFHSGVKVGAHTVLSPFAKWKDIKDINERKGLGWDGQDENERILTTTEGIRDYVVEQLSNVPYAVHVLPMKYYGISSSTPAHAADEKIAWVAQAEKQIWAGDANEEITVRGDKISLGNARTLYNKIKAADIILEAERLRKLFQNTDELERVFQEEIASKSYSSGDVKYALAHLRDGSFGIPLYSPNVEHQIQQLLASIIKKRLTKPKKKGVAMLQTTSLGVDFEASTSQFDEFDSISNSEKLKIEFEGDGEKRRIKYVEVYMPIHDSRLKQFADENGNIPPERLNKLIEDNVIPESILEFIAFRTPSDAEHSVIPCRIKGFTANVEGATIRMPKEIMLMTGHDYDGDKIRCYFKDFDTELSGSDDVSIVKTILGQRKSSEITKIVPIDYDYSKSPFENSQIARDNARVELMFSKITSPMGSRMMIIPGGCEETSVLAKTLYVIKSARDNNLRSKIADAFVEQGMDAASARETVNKTKLLYAKLMSMSDGAISDVVSVIADAESPFSVKHSNDAFESIMGGASMIGPYAVYSSAFQMLQRMDIHYVPRLTREGKEYSVNILGNSFDKLFNVRNGDKLLGAFTLGHLVNAAVDNNKNPILGYLDQNHNNAELTFLLASAGIPEEHIHLIMNQPAVVELFNRMKRRENEGFYGELEKIINELSAGSRELGDISQWVALKKIQKLTKDDFVESLPVSFEEIKEGQDFSAIENQIYILRTLEHLNPTAEFLGTFVRLTRPEADSRAMGTSIASIILKANELKHFRAEVLNDQRPRLSGIAEVLKEREVYDGSNSSSALDKMGNELPEVVALNTFMMDNGTEMFSSYFPLAKPQWSEYANYVLSEYTRAKEYEKEKILRTIGEEMVLYRLLSDRRFVTEDPQEEQRRILIDVPKNLFDLLSRISDSERKDSDVVANRLANNAFLNKLRVIRPNDGTESPRIQFTMGGAAVEGQRDLISASWGELVFDEDEKVRQLAIDLFKYCMYTNGFSYGMYEFFHFAPFSLLYSVPGYLPALRDIMKSGKIWEFSDSSDDTDNGKISDAANFLEYYFMNHWGDKRLVRHIPQSFVNFSHKDGVLFVNNSNDEGLLWALQRMRYVVLTSGEDNKVQTLYRVSNGTRETPIILEPAPKLGSVNFNQQKTLQYNPSVDYHNAHSVVTGNDSAWGNFEDLNYSTRGNINAAGERYDSGAYSSSSFAQIAGKLGYVSGNPFGLETVAKSIEELDEKAAVASSRNEKALASAQPSSIGSFVAGFGLQVSEDALSEAAIETGTEDELDGRYASIVRVEDDGKITTGKFPWTPRNIRIAREQKAYARLNEKLREILREHGVSVGVLTEAEARLSLAGISDFRTANVLANGMKELIRLANGKQGEYALPEEFAHISLAMLGYDNELVQRLFNVLRSDRDAMEEAFDGQYAEYERRYGADNIEKLVKEAAGKLVAKNLLQEQKIITRAKRLVERIVEGIKNLFRGFREEEIQNAIFDANDIASRIARGMLSGKLADELSLNNVTETEQFHSAKNDLTDKNDILSKLLQTEVKRLSILKKRVERAKTPKDKQGVLRATEVQIAKLESAIKNYKSETAIVSYLNDSLDFISEVEKSLDEAVDSGRPMNSICRKLNVVRDTLYSFSSSMEAISDAIVSGEINDTADITSSLNNIAGVLSKFHNKYEILARTCFENMLSEVYGEHGITVSSGKEKGRNISIHEMATKADSDISFMSRMFHAIADCNDYVLSAFDEVVRSAKIRARRRAEAIRPRIEVAMADLIRETGSRDQSFMFEKVCGEDGKYHRTGKYISEAESKKLSPERKKFYDTMMGIKKEVDKYLPDSLVEDNRIIMLRKSTVDKYKDAEGAKDKALVMWEGLRNRVMDTSDNIDYENYEVVVDFEGNRVDMLPVKFLQKGKHESYDDMTDDVATSVMAYAGMATEYNELNDVIGILENAKYMASERNVAQKTGNRKQRESIGFDSNGNIDEDMPAYFRKPYTVKQARTHIQAALEDFFMMHVYGHIRKNEGTIGNTRISKRKVVDTLNSITSVSQMAINIPQRFANVFTGKMNTVLETASFKKAGRLFSMADMRWADKIYLTHTADRLAETGKTDYDNKLSLWSEHFDVHQVNGKYSANYKKGDASRVFNSGLMYAGLRMGEDYLAITTALALARNFKVKSPDGKVETLWDAYEVKYLDDVNKTGAYLSLKSGYTKEDGSAITAKDEEDFQNLVAGTNFELQGIYNTDDKSSIQQYSFGALIIMYRKWIAPALKRRYAGILDGGKAHYDIRKDRFEEGYYVTLFRLITQSAKDATSEESSAKAMLKIFTDLKAYRNAVLVNKNKLTAYERSNIKRAETELGVVIGLFAACALLGKVPPPDTGDEDVDRRLTWWDQTALHYMLRLRTELGSIAPTPMLIDESMHILKSPFAAIEPMQNIINTWHLLIPWNYFIKEKSGRYAGHSKAYKYFRKIPGITIINHIDKLIDPSNSIRYYQNDAQI